MRFVITHWCRTVSLCPRQKSAIFGRYLKKTFQCCLFTGRRHLGSAGAVRVGRRETDGKDIQAERSEGKLPFQLHHAHKANYSFSHNWHQLKLICACHFWVCFSSLTTHEPTALNDLMDRQTPRGALWAIWKNQGRNEAVEILRDSVLSIST